MKISLPLFILTIISNVLFSQAMFVDEGNAYGFMGLYQSEEIEGGKSTTLAGMGTYLLNGNIEFGIEYDILSNVPELISYRNKLGLSPTD